MAYRSMDVQEATVRMTKDHESFRMDNAICELSADVRYKYHGQFFMLCESFNMGQITSIPLKIRQIFLIMHDDEIRKAGV